MQCEQLNERLADYWAGALSEAERAIVEAHVATCAACRREAAELGETWRALGALPDEEPSPSLERRFSAMLDAWREGERHAAAAQERQRPAALPLRFDRDRAAAAPALASPRRTRNWHPVWQLAAAALIAFAGFAAGRSWPDAAAHHEIGELRGEVRGMREMVALALLQQDSAVERLRGVSFSHQLDRPSSVVLNTLLDTLSHDPNVNVRLATIDALRGFANEERVRSALVDALRRQPAPLVQISLIDVMVDMREKRSVEVLRAMVSDQKTNDAVRQRARRGLQQLS
jgi:HEAT repeats/Putative zinc-finger